MVIVRFQVGSSLEKVARRHHQRVPDGARVPIVSMLGADLYWPAWPPLGLSQNPEVEGI